MEQDCCRICLSKTLSFERQDLFLKEYSNLSVLGRLYEEVFNLPIDGERITLKYICNSCGLQLKLFQQLKNKALETYLFLIDLFNAIPCKDANRVEDKNEERTLPPDADTLSSIQFKDEYFVENVENTSIGEYIDDCQDNEQPEIDITQNITTEDDAKQNDLNDNDVTEDDIENEMIENDVTENYITGNCINESDITGIDTIENYLDSNSITKNDHDMDDGIEDTEEQQENEEYNSVEEFIKTEENIPSETSDDEYEICYLDEDMIVENYEKEIDQEEYDEESLINEENTNENNLTSKTVEFKEIYHCPHCDETFKLKTQLKIHKKKMHPITTKIQCPICNKALLSKETYQAHINVHNGLPAYQCNICEKAFNQKVHYNYHILNHNNERNIICDVCQKGFISNGDLKTHMRCHTDERPYKCDICDKRFRAHTHMVNHRYSHFEKQFECPECFQKYMSPNTLRTHFKAVHNAEVPFECEYCEKRFKRKHHLQAHYKTHAKVIGSITTIEE